MLNSLWSQWRFSPHRQSYLEPQGKFLLIHSAWPPAAVPEGNESFLQPVLDLPDLLDKDNAHSNSYDTWCLQLGNWIKSESPTDSDRSLDISSYVSILAINRYFFCYLNLNMNPTHSLVQHICFLKEESNC